MATEWQSAHSHTFTECRTEYEAWQQFLSLSMGATHIDMIDDSMGNLNITANVQTFEKADTMKEEKQIPQTQQLTK